MDFLAKASSWSKRVDLPTLAIAPLLVLVNLPIFHPDLHFFPSHDSQVAYQIFFTTYNELVGHGELPLWRPYDSFGMPGAIYSFMSLSFAQHFSMIVGCLLGVKNVLILFKASMVLEQLALAFGSLLLARRITGNGWAGLLVALCLTCTSLWGHQIWWNFRFLYGLPLVFWLAYVAIEDRRPWLGALAAATYVIHLFGNLPYFVGVHLFAAAFFFMPLLIRIKLRPYLPLRAWIAAAPLALGSICLAGALSLSFKASTAGQVCLTRGRDPVTLNVALDSTLTYGAGLRPTDLSEVLFSVPAHEDYNFYFGLIPLALILWLLLYGKIQNPIDRGLAWAGSALLLCSFGPTTIVAPLADLLSPYFSFVRHLGYFKVIVRMFGFLLLGLAARQWSVAAADPRAVRQALRIAIGLFLGIQYVRLVSGGALYYTDIHLPMDFHHFSLILLALWAIVLLRSIRSGSTGSTLAVTWLFIVVELLSYNFYHQFHSNSRIPSGRAIQPQYREQFDRVTKVTRYTYAARRQGPSGPHHPHGEPMHPVLTATYPIVPSTLYADQLEIPGRVDWLGENIHDLLVALSNREAGDTVWDQTSEPTRGVIDLPDARIALGCDRDKLFLAQAVHYVSDRRSAVEEIRSGGLAQGRVILEGNGAPVAPGAGGDSIAVAHFSANRIKVAVNVGNPRAGAWLVYTDQWHPRWFATVDSNPVPIIRANLAFKAVWVPQGSHDVEFRFRDWTISRMTQWTSLVLGVLAGAALLLSWAASCMRVGVFGK